MDFDRERIMEWTINMKVKDYVRNWSDQEICTEYKNVRAVIKIKDTDCVISLVGEKYVEEVFYLIWELLYLYDGYFYEPLSYKIDGEVRNSEELIKVPFYRTDKQWYSSELIGRSKRNLSTKVLEKYDIFRNADIGNKKMTKSVVHAFYYLNSENYGKINVNHRLSLLLNIADGFVINTFKETNNVKVSLDKIFSKTVNIQRLQQGISLLGIEGEKYKYILTEERHTFDHYIYLENSLATWINGSEEKIANYANWYFVYVLELVIRINFLKEADVVLDQEAVDYALESINDWVIFENDLDVECKTFHYQIAQKLRR